MTMFYAYGIVLFNANYRAPSSTRLNSFKRQTMCEEFNANLFVNYYLFAGASVGLRRREGLLPKMPPQ